MVFLSAFAEKMIVHHSTSAWGIVLPFGRRVYLKASGELREEKCRLIQTCRRHSLGAMYGAILGTKRLSTFD
jgi:hypothetical protein